MNEIRERLEEYRKSMEMLPAIASERALTNHWEKHPMFGINSPHRKDEWAKAYQRRHAIADAIFKQILIALDAQNE